MKASLAEIEVLPTRDEAAKIIAPYMSKTHAPYRCLMYDRVRFLLGPEVFSLLERDPIRRLGPTRDTVYEWNVIDYLTSSGLRGE